MKVEMYHHHHLLVVVVTSLLLFQWSHCCWPHVVEGSSIITISSSEISANNSRADFLSVNDLIAATVGEINGGYKTRALPPISLARRRRTINTSSQEDTASGFHHHLTRETVWFPPNRCSNCVIKKSIFVFLCTRKIETDHKLPDWLDIQPEHWAASNPQAFANDNHHLHTMVIHHFLDVFCLHDDCSRNVSVCPGPGSGSSHKWMICHNRSGYFKSNLSDHLSSLAYGNDFKPK